jgi:hypothetical protein
MEGPPEGAVAPLPAPSTSQVGLLPLLWLLPAAACCFVLLLPMLRTLPMLHVA